MRKRDRKIIGIAGDGMTMRRAKKWLHPYLGDARRKQGFPKITLYILNGYCKEVDFTVTEETLKVLPSIADKSMEN